MSCLNTMPESLLTTTHDVLEDYVSCGKGKEVKLAGGGEYLSSCLNTRSESLPTTTRYVVDGGLHKRLVYCIKQNDTDKS